MDPILGTKILFNKDKDPRKVNLGIGAYRNNEGKPYVLQAVRKAEALIAADKTLDHEYLAIEGHQGFYEAARAMLFGKDCKALVEKRIATVHTLSGTGALRVGAETCAEFYKGAHVYVSDPTWGNHNTIFEKAHMVVKKYRYWDAKKRGLDFQGMCEDLRKAVRGSIIVLHGCAHNPTGVDPTFEQWKQISEIVKAQGHIAFFDVAYQGFATGDLDSDRKSLRYFTDLGLPVMVCQSFAKNFGLYDERAGTFSIVCQSPAVVEAVISQIQLIIRPMYSNPPAHGARIIHKILTTPELYAEWEKEMRDMSLRIQTCRKLLFDELKRLGTPGDWSHITSQIGMFSYTGLSVKQCESMIADWHVYMLKNGRISMAGVNSSNVQHLAKAIDHVVRNVH